MVGGYVQLLCLQRSLPLPNARNTKGLVCREKIVAFANVDRISGALESHWLPAARARGKREACLGERVGGFLSAALRVMRRDDTPPHEHAERRKKNRTPARSQAQRECFHTHFAASSKQRQNTMPSPASDPAAIRGELRRWYSAGWKAQGPSSRPTTHRFFSPPRRCQLRVEPELRGRRVTDMGGVVRVRVCSWC